jgi:hypothetical protein
LSSPPGTHVQVNARVQPIVVTVAAALLAALGANSAAAQAAPADAKSCVYLPDIDHTKIVDQRNILFYMRNRTILQNVFREPCYGLNEKSRFAYGSSSLKRLCAGNIIAVLADLSFGGVATQNTCRLGMFVPLDNDEVDDLLIAAGKDKGGGQKKQAIKTQPVEVAPATSPEGAPQPTPAENAPLLSGAENAAPAPPAEPDNPQR